jgi:hypothetical protein
MIPDFERILNRFGLSNGYRRVTLGKGVVGKSTSAFIGMCGVFGLVAVGLIESVMRQLPSWIAHYNEVHPLQPATRARRQA